MSMRFLSLFSCAVAVSAFLGACSVTESHNEVDALKEAKAVGSPFTQRLTTEYKAITQSKQKAMDYADAKHFAKKGLMAAEGKVVLPEPLNNWHLDDGSAKDLRAARILLMQAMNSGARAQAPAEAAMAQAKFDCWIEQQEQSWATIHKASCRAGFEKAMADLNARMGNALPKSDKMGKPVPQPVAPAADPNAVAANMDEGMFLVFFDFNRSLLNGTGLQVVDAVAKQAKERKDLKTITIIGHADTSGSDKYNQRLSIKRAQAVKAALAEKGLDIKIITAEGHGEKELMVQTPNNTREPANRRAEIRFE